ncbi:MAG: PQQ-dependent sugar dehydrogenase, partial [Vicinamibacterales bacterium]
VEGQAARPMLMVDEPGTRRLFVNDMRGPLYSVSRDGKSVTLYLDVDAPAWEVNVNSSDSERGFQSFAFHPQFNQRGTPGFGKLYTYTDTSNTEPVPDFVPGGGKNSHDTVLLEWTAKTPAAATYDGGPPRELMRFEQPFGNHNGGQVGFNPLARPRDADFGLLYVGAADGGSGGDPLELGQNLQSAFGKLLRLDPLGSNSANGKYGIPAGNPLVKDGDPKTLGEIYAWGLRNPQRFTWDSRSGNLFVADIGQNTVEEISIVTAGANLGWNDWEGSFGFVNRAGVRLDNQRGDPRMTYPVVEYGQTDPLLQRSVAVTVGSVYRGTAMRELAGLLLFGDNPSGEIFYIHADKLPRGGQDSIRRILFAVNGSTKLLLELINENRAKQGKAPARRADLRFGEGPGGQVFVLNKQDGIIRLLVPAGTTR